MIRTAYIMHQHADGSYIISMIILNLEVIDCCGRFQYLMLDFFNDYILAAYQDKDISGMEVYSVCPALDWRVEGYLSKIILDMLCVLGMLLCCVGIEIIPNVE